MASQSTLAPIVIKVGGKFFEQLREHNSGSQQLLDAIHDMQLRGRQIVLVHGGGDQVQALMSELNRPSTKHEGLRVTPSSDMPVVAGVLAGTLNKQLVAEMKAKSIVAAGISLADGDIAVCSPLDEALGQVGTPDSGDKYLLSSLLNNNIVPVIASIGANETGDLFNVNADHAAIHVAKILSAELYFFSDVKGVLDANKNLVTELSHSLCDQMLADGVITDGMVVKVKASQEAANRLGKQIVIASWDNAKVLLIDGKAMGTAVLPTIKNATHS
ncbi:acetylglutamate kinase [Agaribacter flavus]|uniref:Acetylglutamate kinase n=1 Tax=Agaribacter flavus TaxID=1902781 RepID=A0ABV7FWZ5_9ALTE